MEKLSRFLSPVLFLFIVFAGCRKDNIADTSPVTMSDLNIADGFNWETSRIVHISVSIDLLPANIGLLSKISVYAGNPEKDGQLLASGAAGYRSDFEYDLRIASALQKLYLKADDGMGYVYTDSVDVADQINVSFSQRAVKSLKQTTIGPDCSGATQANTLSGSQTYNLNSGGTYYVTGSFTGSVNFGGSPGTIVVCGTMHPQNLNNLGNGWVLSVSDGGSFIMNTNLILNGNSTFTAYDGSHVSLGGLNMNGSTAKLINYSSDFVIGSLFSANGSIENYGSLILNSGFNINSGSGLLLNSGTMAINGNFNMGSSLTNSGTIEISGAFSLNSGTLTLNCELVVHNSLSIGSGTIIMNGAYLKVDNQFTINSGGTLQMQNGSMLSASSYAQNKNVQGSGSRSEIVIADHGYINGSYKVDGPIEMVTPSGTLAPGGSANFINGATLRSTASASNVIPVTACNPEGFGGIPPVSDSDGDGIPDTLDDYPDDNTRAFDNYYPSQSGFGSLAYEDMWPSKGDYDLNDLVVDYRYNIITNALNKVVDIKPEFSVRAAGAGFKDGFGVQIDGVLPAQIESISGCSARNTIISTASNGAENNQAKAVFVVFDNFNNVIHRANGASYFNTSDGDPKGWSDTLSISIHLLHPLEQAVVGAPPYNAFLIKNMDRQVEIHLAGYVPTSLANTALFGTGNDDSDPADNRYYKTDGNLPWALNLPVRFDYTSEHIPVIEGYNHFASWAESSGSQYSNWYSDQNGYRNVQEIYH